LWRRAAQRRGIRLHSHFLRTRQTFVLAAQRRRARPLRRTEPRLSAYIMRAAGPRDLEGFKQLREVAGAGFTSLMLDDAGLAAKLALSEQSFASTTTTAGFERYFIALEHVDSGELAGCCGVKSTIGETPPFFNFRMITEAQSSSVVNRRFDMRVLIGVND